jgi:HEAT repeats
MHTFHRSGRSLAEWLLQLVSDRPSARAKAGKLLQNWWQGLPEGCSEFEEFTAEQIVTLDGAADRFDATVRAVVRDEKFPTADFVDRLCGQRIALNADWLERCAVTSRQHERVDALLDRARTRNPARLTTERLIRVIGAQSARIEAVFANAESTTAVGMANLLVFKALDVAFLASENALEALLDYEPERREAYQALARIGPPAVRFAPQLLEHLEETPSNYRYEVPLALGRIGRDHAPTVAAVIDRLNHANSEIRNAAIATLGQMGPELAGQNEEVIQRLLARCDAEATSWWAVGAVTSVAPTDTRVLAKVLALMAPRPPVIAVHEQSGYRYEGDQVMYQRGYAIQAAAKLTAFPEQIVPQLIEAIDTFLEFDCDEGYYGEHSRVCTALIAFGPAAVLAVPKLKQLLAASDEQHSNQLRLIAAIGPAARELLPYLMKLRDEPESPLDPQMSELDAAILVLQT